VVERLIQPAEVEVAGAANVGLFDIGANHVGNIGRRARKTLDGGAPGR
jgi:hypothetical protein